MLIHPNISDNAKIAKVAFLEALIGLDTPENHQNMLEKLFNCIEVYQAGNLGFRSKENLGVWLAAFATCEDGAKDKIVDELLELADIDTHLNVKPRLKMILNHLALPENLKAIIDRYIQSFGSFSLNVNSAALEEFKNTLQSKNLGFLLPYVNKADKILEISMANQVNFKWKDKLNNNIRLEKKVKKQYFPNNQTESDPIQYLTIDSNKSDIYFKVVAYGEENYYVTRLKMGADSKNENSVTETNPGYCYLVEPVRKSGYSHLTTYYYDIIKAAEQQQPLNNKTIVEQLLNISPAHALRNVKIKNPENVEHAPIEYVVFFPKLVRPLKTTEKRLGPYRVFLNKMLCNILATPIEFQGEREISCDETGVDIKNSERFLVLESASLPIDSSSTKIKYVVRGPYMVIVTNGGTITNANDSYPFFISDPNKDLQKIFGETGEMITDRQTISTSPHGVFSSKNDAVANAKKFISKFILIANNKKDHSETMVNCIKILESIVKEEEIHKNSENIMNYINDFILSFYDILLPDQSLKINIREVQPEKAIPQSDKENSLLQFLKLARQDLDALIHQLNDKDITNTGSTQTKTTAYSINF